MDVITAISAAEETHRLVPDVVWGALIAATSSMITSWLSNRNSRAQVRDQLDSSDRQKKIERDHGLRRDVFLPAIEALTSMQNLLAQMINPILDSSELLKPFMSNVAIINKAYLVASQSTVAALMRYQSAFMPAFSELITWRPEITTRLQLIQQQQRFMDAALASHENLIQKAKEANVAGSRDPMSDARLRAVMESELTRHAEHAERQNQLSREQALSILSKASQLEAIVSVTAPLLVEALIEARAELGLGTDQQAFRQAFSIQQQMMLAAMRGTVNRLRAVLGQPNAS